MPPPGWLLRRTRQSSIGGAVGAAAFALTLGHNVPLVGATTAAGKKFALMPGVMVVAALALAIVHAWLAPLLPAAA